MFGGEWIHDRGRKTNMNIFGVFSTQGSQGLGMVKEVSYDNADTSTPLMTKTLTAFTGLVP